MTLNHVSTQISSMSRTMQVTKPHADLTDKTLNKKDEVSSASNSQGGFANNAKAAYSQNVNVQKKISEISGLGQNLDRRA